MKPLHALVFRCFGELSVAAGYILVVLIGLYEHRTSCAIEGDKLKSFTYRPGNVFPL